MAHFGPECSALLTEEKLTELAMESSGVMSNVEAVNVLRLIRRELESAG